MGQSDASWLSTLIFADITSTTPETRHIPERVIKYWQLDFKNDGVAFIRYIDRNFFQMKTLQLSPIPVIELRSHNKGASSLIVDAVESGSILASARELGKLGLCWTYDTIHTALFPDDFDIISAPSRYTISEGVVELDLAQRFELFLRKSISDKDGDSYLRTLVYCG